ncbi:hypothetical protein [Pseudosporangium ferrugineum]|uniref:Uncharacterized protein n=1 Tax=Pseudosporangium ferrugineum TaxID=439699 RepID=A0A2T0RNN8_9ACTN|nr:hypothetical protein [Pseudosporangium ferrugineum]PRY22747.1 hypothetical protein CLV70_1166 [Pseudosporangium ferrugineum]
MTNEREIQLFAERLDRLYQSTSYSLGEVIKLNNLLVITNDDKKIKAINEAVAQWRKHNLQGRGDHGGIYVRGSDGGEWYAGQKRHFEESVLPPLEKALNVLKDKARAKNKGTSHSRLGGVLTNLGKIQQAEKELYGMRQRFHDRRASEAGSRAPTTTAPDQQQWDGLENVASRSLERPNVPTMQAVSPVSPTTGPSAFPQMPSPVSAGTSVPPGWRVYPATPATGRTPSGPPFSPSPVMADGYHGEPFEAYGGGAPNQQVPPPPPYTPYAQTPDLGQTTAIGSQTRRQEAWSYATPPPVLAAGANIRSSTASGADHRFPGNPPRGDQLPPGFSASMRGQHGQGQPRGR